MRARALPVLLALALALPGTARAAEADPYIERAESLMDEAEYTRAQKIIDRGLARRGLDDDVLRQLYFLEGTVWVSLGQRGRARSSYAKVLTIDPAFRLGTRVPRKVRDSFEVTREEMLRSGDLESIYDVHHTPLGNLAPGQDAEARLAFGNRERGAEVERVVLHVRRLGTSDYAAIDATRADGAGAPTFIARVPPYLLSKEAEPYAVEYYLDAFGRGSDARVAGAGNAELPLTFLVVPESTSEGEGLEDEGFPFLPVAIGGAIAAAAVATVAVVAAVFLLRPSTGSATVVITQEAP